MDTTSTFTLNNGVEIPVIGLGVYQSSPEDTAGAVRAALDAGYRHVDTAAAYGNEVQVGEAIAASGLPRSDVFVETKVWISDYGHDETLHAFEKATGKLGVDTLDLLILHQALPSDFERTIAAYQALEQLLEQGKVRAIGVSNFMPDHLDQLLAATDVVPAVNQIECHPYFQQPELLEKHRQLDILTQCWSPIGGITFYREGEHTSTLDDPTIGEIARKHDRSAAQVMLRWHVQEGRQVIPKSVKAHRIQENADIFGFELSQGELDAINALETGRRGGPEPTDITLEKYGMPIPEAPGH